MVATRVGQGPSQRHFPLVQRRRRTRCVTIFDTRNTQTRASLINTYSMIAGYDYPYCTPVSANVTYSKNAGVNYTYGAGVTIEGVSLSARAGWDSGVNMSFTPTGNAYICYSSSSGWTYSSGVSNKPR